MKILYIQYANPGAFPVAMRAGRLWRAAGHEVHYLGLDFGGNDRLAVAADLVEHCDLIAYSKLAPVRFAARAVEIARRWKPDCLYIADSMAALACTPLRKLHAGTIVYHEHDAPAFARSFRFRLQSSARAAIARRADAVVLPNADRGALLARDAGLAPGHAPIIAWNTPARDEVGPPRPAASAGPVRVVYAGSINVHRVPFAMIEALADVPAVELTLIGYETVSSRGHCARLRALAAERGCAGRLHIRDAMPYHALVETLRDYDATFAALATDAEDINLRFMAGASNKSFDAMGQGLALIVGPGDDWRKMFVDPGYAVACDPADAASIADAFRRLGADRDAVRAMGEAARQRIASDWAYDAQLAPVTQIMERSGGAAR